MRMILCPRSQLFNLQCTLPWIICLHSLHDIYKLLHRYSGSSCCARLASLTLYSPWRVTCLLLHYMRQFMCQQLLSLSRTRRILACPKHHILPHCICTGIQRLCRLNSLSIRMDAHMTEVRAKACLHQCTIRSIERQSWAEVLQETTRAGCRDASSLV